MKILYFKQTIFKSDIHDLKEGENVLEKINLDNWKEHIFMTCKRIDSNAKIYKIIVDIIGDENTFYRTNSEDAEEVYHLIAIILYDGNLGEHYNDFVDIYNMYTREGVYPANIIESWYEISYSEILRGMKETLLSQYNEANKLENFILGGKINENKIN